MTPTSHGKLHRTTEILGYARRRVRMAARGANASAWSPWTAAFVQRLRELGWIGGRLQVLRLKKIPPRGMVSAPSWELKRVRWPPARLGLLTIFRRKLCVAIPLLVVVVTPAGNRNSPLIPANCRRVANPQASRNRLAVSFDHRLGTGEQLPTRTLSELAVVP
jgi:hypothetical protein